MQERLVSVIVPVYNAEKYLEECIDSILNQTYKNFELLLIDDGSTDLSGAICEQYKENDYRIRVFHRKNAGAAAARNFGIEQAKGYWVTFVDSDDWITNNYIETLAVNDKELEVCFVNTRKKRRNRKTSLSGEIHVLDKEHFHAFERCLLNKYADSNHPHLTSACAKLYKKDFLLQYSIKFPEKLKKSEDAIFNMQVYNKAKTGLWNTAELYNYRINGESITHSYDQNAIKTYKRHLMYVRKFYQNCTYSQFERDYEVRAIFDFIYCILHDFCHLKNYGSYAERKKKFIIAKNDSVFHNGIQNVKTKGFTLEERILIFMIKNNLFFALNAIIRTIQKIERYL